MSSPGNMESQMSLTTKMSLAAAKEARKRAELDAQLLANRIALLKQEEEKAWKKIEDTRKRAKEIMTLRQQNEQKFVAKEDFYKQKWESIRDAQHQNAYARDKARSTREATRTALVAARKQGVSAIKHMSQESAMQRREREMYEKQLNKEKTFLIKKQKEEMKKRLEAEQMAKLEAYRQQYEGRVGQEEMLRARTEALVAKMEKEEMELIQRLQNTQLVQRNAYEELEGALGTTSQSLSATIRQRPDALSGVGGSLYGGSSSSSGPQSARDNVASSAPLAATGEGLGDPKASGARTGAKIAQKAA